MQSIIKDSVSDVSIQGVAQLLGQGVDCDRSVGQLGDAEMGVSLKEAREELHLCYHGAVFERRGGEIGVG